ncbi:MAG: SPOR domain-containing protein [Prevotellaceae bacterium]|nr:SPOR domain-containing protein [Prevotellaceae bacterium]
MSSVVTDYSSAYSSPQYSAYYVVVGSFLNKSNANAYLRSMQNTFGKAQIVNSGRWNFVCVGGQFDSFSSARATLSNVKSQRVNGGGGGSSSSRVAAADDDEDEGGDDDEESYDEEEDEGGDEEDEGGDEEGEGEEDTGDEEDYGSSSSGESVGQAWVLGI